MPSRSRPARSRTREDQAAARAPANDGTTLRSLRTPPVKPGEARVLEGLRVVEIGTVMAAPISSRLLSDFGADVVKIEEADGDSIRKLFLEYEQPRTQSSMFDCASPSLAGRSAAPPHHACPSPPGC